MLIITYEPYSMMFRSTYDDVPHARVKSAGSIQGRTRTPHIQQRKKVRVSLSLHCLEMLRYQAKKLHVEVLTLPRCFIPPR
jgi:hypothetical protein